MHGSNVCFYVFVHMGIFFFLIKAMVQFDYLLLGGNGFVYTCVENKCVSVFVHMDNWTSVSVS